MSPSGLQQPAQRAEGLAEALAGGMRVGFRPEQLDQLLARVGARGEIGQASEQQRRLLRGEMRYALVLTRGPQPAEQFDPPRSLHAHQVLLSGRSLNS